MGGTVATHDCAGRVVLAGNLSCGILTHRGHDSVWIFLPHTDGLPDMLQGRPGFLKFQSWADLVPLLTYLTGGEEGTGAAAFQVGPTS